MRYSGRDERWLRELRAWDPSTQLEPLDDRERALLRQRVLAEIPAATRSRRSVGWLVPVGATAAVLVALALVVTFRLMPATASGRGATLTVGVTARLDLDVARADIGESLELASIEPPQLPPLVGQAARNVALAAAPEVDSNALREEARRVRRFALRTPSGRQIHWVLDSEFAGLSTGGDE